MIRKLLPLAIAGAMMTSTAMAAGVGLDVNVAGFKVDKKADVKTEAAQDATGKASAKADAGLGKANAANAKANAKVDGKMGAAKEQAGMVDALTGTNTSESVGKADAKVKAAQSKADAASKTAADAKAGADAHVHAGHEAVNTAPAAANAKVQGKLNAMGLGQ